MKAKDLVEVIENEILGKRLEEKQREWFERQFAHLKLKVADLQEVQDAHYNLWRLLKELE